MTLPTSPLCYTLIIWADSPSVFTWPVTRTLQKSPENSNRRVHLNAWGENYRANQFQLSDHFGQMSPSSRWESVVWRPQEKKRRKSDAEPQNAKIVLSRQSSFLYLSQMHLDNICSLLSNIVFLSPENWLLENGFDCLDAERAAAAKMPQALKVQTFLISMSEPDAS